MFNKIFLQKGSRCQ